MVDIRSFIKDHLLYPLTKYPTTIQDTMLEIIIDRLEKLYELAVVFPEIISPNSSRLDILKVIADQFVFLVRDDADLQEQINILDQIIYVYNRRGSIDTIENMWKYYGGKLPKEVKVSIPSYNLFRYSISTFSGTHVFPDGATNRTGVYEIRLYNNTYPIPDLREFLIRELVAAGNFIYFTNILHMELLSSNPASNPFKYLVYQRDIKYLQLSVLKDHQGLTWSGINPLSRNSEDSYWSGRGSIFLEVTNIMSIYLDSSFIFTPDPLGFHFSQVRDVSEVRFPIYVQTNSTMHINLLEYSTPIENTIFISRNLYNSQGEIIEDSNYPGYFILGESLLGKEVI